MPNDLLHLITCSCVPANENHTLVGKTVSEKGYEKSIYSSVSERTAGKYSR